MRLTARARSSSVSDRRSAASPMFPGPVPLQAPHAPRQRTVRVGEYAEVYRHPMSRQLGRQLVVAPQQFFPRLAVGLLREPLAVGIAEYVGEKHVGIVATGLEQDDVGVLVLDFVLGQAGLHARMDDGAEGLCQHHRQAAVDQLALLEVSFMRRMLRIEGHQRIDAKHQPRAGLERNGRMQRLLQRTIDVPAAVDLDRRIQVRAAPRWPGRRGDRHMVEALARRRRPKSRNRGPSQPGTAAS
jgi:hypothetical protein